MGATDGILRPGDGRGAYAVAAARRDRVADCSDDAAYARKLEESGSRVIRGRGRIVGPGLLAVGDRTIECTSSPR
jgi:hypothetical protein